MQDDATHAISKDDDIGCMQLRLDSTGSYSFSTQWNTTWSSHGFTHLHNAGDQS